MQQLFETKSKQIVEVTTHDDFAKKIMTVHGMVHQRLDTSSETPPTSRVAWVLHVWMKRVLFFFLHSPFFLFWFTTQGRTQEPMRTFPHPSLFVFPAGKVSQKRQNGEQLLNPGLNQFQIRCSKELFQKLWWPRFLPQCTAIPTCTFGSVIYHWDQRFQLSAASPRGAAHVWAPNANCVPLKPATTTPNHNKPN